MQRCLDFLCLHVMNLTERNTVFQFSLPAQQYHGVCIEHSQFQKHRTLQLKSASESKSNLFSVPKGETEAREEVQLMDLTEWLRLLAAWQGLSLLPDTVPSE